MSKRKYEAKERVVQKMSRDGLLEESLKSGTQKRISNRVLEDLSLQGPVTDSEAPADPDTDIRKRQKLKQRAKVHKPDKPSAYNDGSQVGGEYNAARSDEKQGNKQELGQSRRAEKYWKGIYSADTGSAYLRKEIFSEEDAWSEGTEEAEEELTSRHSSRMNRYRVHPAFNKELPETAHDVRHEQNQKQAQRYASAKNRHRQRLSETVPDSGSLSEHKEEIKSKQKKERLNQEQRKLTAGRLSFDDEAPEGTMVRGSGIGFGKKIVSGIAGTAAAAVHAKIDELEDENAGVSAAHSGELIAEEAVINYTVHTMRLQKEKKVASRRKADHAGLYKLSFNQEPEQVVQAAKQEADKKKTIRKFFQKQRYRRMYATAKQEEKAADQVFRTSQSLASKAAAVVKEAFRRNSGVLIGLGVLGLMALLISASVTSCTAVIQGAGSSVVSTTYASTDEEIHKVEDAYEEMERKLNEQINGIADRYPDYNSFRYQIDEISHNPYHLISYFTTKYGEFTYDQVKDELEEIFQDQYNITVTKEPGVTITETKKVRVGESLGQVVTSGYCNCPLCCGQWSGGPTASGVYPTSNHTIAVDAYNPFVPMGTHVIMNGTEYVVEDTGAFASYGVQFDVYYDDHQTAQNHGHKTWDAYLADSNGSQEIEVTTTETVNRLSVTLTNHNLDAVLRKRLNDDEEKHYDAYNTTLGNRDYLFDLNKIPTYQAGDGYSVPAEALSDERFAKMYNEAKKYLGVPYVWGGYDPSGFDCSGFVSWVINHCGNGWNVGRLGVDGLLSHCTVIPKSEAKPGDLIFFQKTYNVSGASHIGIYLGDGMMIHCGSPVQYANIESSYWVEHYYCMGRFRN